MLVRWNTSTSNKKAFCVGLLSLWLNSKSFRQSRSKLLEGHWDAFIHRYESPGSEFDGLTAVMVLSVFHNHPLPGQPRQIHPDFCFYSPHITRHLTRHHKVVYALFLSLVFPCPLQRWMQRLLITNLDFNCSWRPESEDLCLCRTFVTFVCTLCIGLDLSGHASYIDNVWTFDI